SHASFPSATLSATMLFSVSAIISFVPSTVISASEAYAGPLPVHFHFWSPVARSYATIPPLSEPPSCAMHNPPLTIGEDAVKNRGHAPEKSSLRHNTFPWAAS